MVTDDAPRGSLDLIEKVRARHLAGAKRNKGLHDMTLERVRLTYYGSLGHCRVVQNGTFDFKRSNAISGTLDNVVGRAPQTKNNRPHHAVRDHRQ